MGAAPDAGAGMFTSRSAAGAGVRHPAVAGAAYTGGVTILEARPLDAPTAPTPPRRGRVRTTVLVALKLALGAAVSAGFAALMSPVA